MTYYEGDTANRQLNVSKILEAPIEQVWEAWINPEHIRHWWGPRGVTVNIHKMDLRAGGDWLLDIIVPDGKKFPNKSVFREIIPNNKIVFEHFNPNYYAIVNFEAKGKSTLIEWKMIIETEKLYDALVNTFKADQGQRDNVEKLSEYLQRNFK